MAKVKATEKLLEKCTKFVYVYNRGKEISF